MQPTYGQAAVGGEQTDSVPFPCGLREAEAQSLPEPRAPGTRQLPEQPGSLPALQLLSFRLRGRPILCGHVLEIDGFNSK